MQYVITNQEPLIKNPNTVYFIKNSTNDNYKLIETDDMGNIKTEQENYLNYIKESINDYKNQFYGRYKGLIIPLIINSDNILTYVNTIIQYTVDKKYPIGVILLFTNNIQYNNNINQAINLLFANNIMVFAGINVENRNIENVLADIDAIVNTYPAIRGLHFNNVNSHANNNNYLNINILTGYAFYRDFEFISVGFNDMLVSDENFARIISDLFVYEVDLSVYPQLNVGLNILSKNRLVFIGKNKQDLQFSDVENYLNNVKFCYFIDNSSLDVLPTYFQLLAELIDKYNYKVFIDRFENIENILQNVLNNLSNVNNNTNILNSQINNINFILQSLQQQIPDFPPLNLKDFVKFDNNTDYILYGKTQDADTQIRLNKNFVYLIPFRLRLNLFLKQLSIYKLFDRKINNKIYVGLYDSDNDNNPTQKLFETEININRLFGMMSNTDNLNILLQSGKIYYFAVVADDNLLLRGLTINNIKNLFGLYTKNNKPLTGFVLPNRDNILPNTINIEKLVPYFDKLPAIYTILDKPTWDNNLEMSIT